MHDTANRAIAAANKMKPIDEWVKNLSCAEVMYLETIINANVNENLKILADSVTNAITDFLYEHNFDVDAELDKLEAKINEESYMIKKYLKRGEDYMSKVEELEPKIIERYKELKEEGKTDKEIMNALKGDFSLISISAIDRVVKKYKRSKTTDEDIERAVESIFEEPTKKAPQSNVSEEKAKTISKSLKVKSLVVEDEEGTEYVKENNTVKVGTMTFENEKDVEDFRNTSLKEYKDGCSNALAERKKEYEEEIAEINRAYEEEKIKFLKKVNNILDVMAM